MALARHATDIQERRAIFTANTNANATTPTNNPWTISTKELAPHDTYSSIGGAS